MNRGEVGEDRGSQEMDGCPLTEMKTGKMVFSSWTDFMDEFELIFCPENEATTMLMTLESYRHF
jgi:hypothetical protein